MRVPFDRTAGELGFEDGGRRRRRSEARALACRLAGDGCPSTHASGLCAAVPDGPELEAQVP
eukprot:750321-Lingulodinium_polyedra.AAC.1